MDAARTRRRHRAALVVVLFMLVPVVVVAPPAEAAVVPIANPTVTEECGIPVTLVLDASGSISQSHAVDTVRDAAAVFLNALKDTGSTARVIDFGSVARQTAPATLVTGDSLAPGGAHADALKKYYNPIPPLQPGVSGYAWRGGSVTNPSNYQRSDSTQYTNWDQSLDQAGRQASDLVVYVTDGDPTAVDSDQPGDPFYVAGKDPPNVRVGMDSGAALQLALDRGIEEANQVKSAGTRMLAVGVGAAVTQSASVARLVQISGPQVVRDTSGITSLNQVDVAVVPDFDDLADLLRQVVTQLCSPSLTIRKLAQTADSIQYEPAQGWSMTVDPTISGGGTYRWIQPAGAPVGAQTVITDSDGFSKFQWEPDPPDRSSTAFVTEATQPGFTPQSAHCVVLHPDDSTTVVDPPDPTSFTVPMGPEDIGTCTIRNSYDYAPAIHVEKVNDPVLVRGDLDPPATVTSSYVVTNPGNTALHGVTVIDDTCGPVNPVPASGANAGDTDDDGVLDPGEEWQFTCTQAIQESITDEPIEITNSVVVTGTDPTGTVVTDDATDDYEVVTPAIHVVKDVEGGGQGPQDEITVPIATNVTYTYAVTNRGNVALSGVTLTDDTPPCSSPAFVGGDTDGDDQLDLSETWTYTCVAAPTASVTNTATVEGTPTRVTPTGPPVTDDDPATVNTIDPQLTLTKEVDQDLVFPGTTVNYTYLASNTGTVDLRNPADPVGDPQIPPTTWITDDQCATVTYDSGDDNDDGLLNPGESWLFECSTEISTPTTNTATIHAVTVSPIPIDLIRSATAFVDVATADIAIKKVALRGVVLDPAADPVAGPDVPTPRRAVYVYEVTNEGGLPLADVSSRITDDKCSPLTRLARADINGNDVLDPGEVWRFTCLATLEQSDGSPPDGSVSALVTNTATVTGTPLLEGTPGVDVSDTDTAQVLVIRPSLTLTKAASDDLVRPGDAVTYTYLVTNTGDVGLELINGGDDICAGVTYEGGDTNGNGLVDGRNSGAREVWRFECTQQIDAPTTNNANVVGIDPLGNHYEATDSAFVDVLLSGIHLDKSVSDDLVLAGSEVTYTFAVTNTGTSPVPANDVLSQVTLSDETEPANAGCDSPTFVGGDTSGDDLLDRGETWTYTCSGVIDQTTSDIATVQGTDLKGGVVESQDTATVTAFEPGISVAKTADPTQVQRGETSTYTYEVTNTGTVPLAGITDSITDDTCSPLTYVTGDLDGDGQLDTSRDIFESGTDETWVFTCTAVITEDTTNTVEVTGVPVTPDGSELCGPIDQRAMLALLQATTCDVTASDQALVTVVTGGGVLPTESARPLPGTGANGLGLIWLGFGLLAAGLVALLVSRPRGRRH